MRRWLRRIGWGAVGVGLCLGVLGLALALASFPAVPVDGTEASLLGFYHVHTVDSHDGHGTLEEAAAAAAALGADFLILTEHNRLLLQAPKRVHGVLVIPGVEISAEAGHVVALGLDHLPDERGPEVLAAIEAAGGMAVLAHPVNLRRPWDDPSPEGFVGFEALSLDSSFREAMGRHRLRLGLPLVALAADRRKLAALLMHHPTEALARYDELVAERGIAMMCGVDAHGLPPYRSSFAALAQHVHPIPATWGDDAGADAAQVLEAIGAARTFCSIPALGDARSFRLLAEAGRVVAEVGTEAATLVLLRDGVEVARGRGPSIEAPAAPGAWRVEAYVSPGFPWGRDRLWIASSSLLLPLTSPPDGT